MRESHLSQFLIYYG